MTKTIDELKAEIKREVQAEMTKTIAELSASVGLLLEIHRVGGKGLAKNGTHTQSIAK